MTTPLTEISTPTTTRAALPGREGGNLVLREETVPGLDAGEVLVRVHAAGVNRADLLHATGTYQQAARKPGSPNVAGMELAGEVVAVGRSEDSDLLGGRVMAMHPGSFAEYAVVDARLLLPVADGVRPTDAAALPIGLMTEYDALVALADAQPGEVCVITAATSGVGLVGVQVAKQRGLTVVAMSRSAKSGAVLEPLGADMVATNLAEVHQAYPGGVNVVLDHVGGSLLTELLGDLASGARVVSVGRLAGGATEIELNGFAAKRATLIGTTWRTRTLDEIAEAALRLGTNGGRNPLPLDLTPVVGSVVPLDRIEGLLRQIEKPRKPGKIIVSMLDKGSE